MLTILYEKDKLLKARKIKQARRHQALILWLIIIGIFLIGAAAGAGMCVMIAVKCGLV